MRLFDKYLLACTNQRIPMPPEWQKSLGLSLSATKQIKIQDTEGINGVELTGYKFQQDDVIERGFVSQEIRSMEFDTDARYLLQLYLRAIADHKGTNFLSYLQLGVSSYSFPLYTTTATVVAGRKYSIYANTIRPLKIKLYSTASGTVFYNNESKDIPSVSTLKQILVDTGKYIEEGYEAEHEFIVLEVTSYVPVAIVEGVFDKLPLTRNLSNYGRYSTDDEYGAYLAAEEAYLKKLHNEDDAPANKSLETLKEELVEAKRVCFKPKEDQTAITCQAKRVCNTMSNFYPNKLPKVGYFPTLVYSDKLIPTLLDMEILPDSTQTLKEQISENLLGSSVQEKVMINTSGVYDVDEYIGGKLIW